MQEFESLLRGCFQGEIYFDSLRKKIYSVDASIFEVEPIGIAVPKTVKDLINAVNIASKFKIPLIPRGAATGITGGCLGNGLILDLSTHLNLIKEINPEQGYAICEPGVIQDQLNEALIPFKMRLGPDTSTGNRATIGGMIGNNAAGARSLKFGTMADHILGLKVLLSNGEIVDFNRFNSLEEKINLECREGEIYREIDRIIKEKEKEIRNKFPDIPRNVSGYNLPYLTRTPFQNLAPFFAGTEGTLGIILEAKLKIVPQLGRTSLVLISFTDVIEAFSHISQILHFKPVSFEMLDAQILRYGKTLPLSKGKLEWLKGDPQALFIVEFEDISKVPLLLQNLKLNGIGEDAAVLEEESEIAQVWSVRQAGLGILLSKRDYTRAIAFIEDISVPPEQLSPFIKELYAYLDQKGKKVGIYGHVGSGCLHIRPYMNLKDPDDMEKIPLMLSDVSKILQKYGGALSGEHGDGMIRSWLNKEFFGESLYQTFLDIKKVFDPDNLMNPGKIVEGSPPLKHLRKLPVEEIPTFFDFSQEGGFALSADLCNGNGRCRKKEGVMCPSFQVTNREYDSTRARAQSFRAVLEEKNAIEKFSSHEIYDVLDLCIECKGCKTECPSQVDMTKMKSEFLYHYQKAHGTRLRSRLFGNIDRLFLLGSYFPNFSNSLMESAAGRFGASLFGLTTQRPFPKLSPFKFSEWFKNYPQKSSKKKAVLFNDTYNEFISPHIGQAAVKVLNNFGYEVLSPPWTCCGRPLLSKGLLKKAKVYGKKVIDEYKRFPYPIIGLEPSCILTFKDEYLSLFSADQVPENVYTFDQFIAQEIEGGKYPFQKSNEQIYIHGHCHQKALIGMEPTLKILRAISSQVQQIPTGCCGMAGSFGYEKEHFDFSLEIANLKLFPFLKTLDPKAIVGANGFSCRTQIEFFGTHMPRHTAEILAAVI